jgi:hypothetical protein
MTGPELAPRKLRKVAAWEYALRFVFGGLVTVGAGLIAKRWGTAFGGMFLAFPAILPASLTLVKQHDGRQRAVDDARGSRVATIALASFALVVMTAAAAWPPAVVLTVATGTWVFVAVTAWRVVLARGR